MKCQNCGKNEVNFHYSSNINGNVTETYLCSECAAKSGYDIGRLFETGGAFDEFFPMPGWSGGFLPIAIPVMDVSPGLSFMARPGIRRLAQQAGLSDCGCGAGADGCQSPQVDDEMKKRRELYMQMRTAAENEEFEKAAELRDKIKELEK